MEKDGRDGSYEHAEELSNPEKGVIDGGVTSYQKAEKLGEKNVEEQHEFMAGLDDSKESVEGEEHPHKRAAAHIDTFEMEKDGRDGSYQHAEELSNQEKGVTGEGVTSYQKAEKLGEKNVEEQHEFMAESNDETKKQTK